MEARSRLKRGPECPELSLLELVSHLAQNVTREETGVQGTHICISLMAFETDCFSRINCLLYPSVVDEALRFHRETERNLCDSRASTFPEVWMKGKN